MTERKRKVIPHAIAIQQPNKKITGSPTKILTARVDDFLSRSLIDSDSSSEGDRYLREIEEIKVQRGSQGER